MLHKTKFLIALLVVLVGAKLIKVLLRSEFLKKSYLRDDTVIERFARNDWKDIMIAINSMQAEIDTKNFQVSSKIVTEKIAAVAELVSIREKAYQVFLKLIIVMQKY